MELTKEQKAIIQSNGDIRINAVAGSGKTSTLIEYAASRAANSKILYLAFNKSVKLEAIRKFAARGLHNVKVETAHSLAYKHIVFKNGYQVKAQEYKTYEIAELLGLKGNGEKHQEFILANHINKFIAYFCNSDKERIQDLNYLEVVQDEKAKSFVRSFYPYIQSQARLLLSKMDKGEIEITHDFYLKKFQLSDPELNYDYILFDEGQDASAAMLSVFLNQRAIKVIVGDTHQQIYGWRYAVNSLERVAFKTFYLTQSFRFDQEIADLAVRVLAMKNLLGQENKIPITGSGKKKETHSKAVIARTNLGLLLKAIEYVTEKKELNKLYFEGNIHSYTYANEGASLYDVLYLFNGKTDKIKDKLLRSMGSMEDLEEYIKKTEDMELSMMVEIVKKYGNSIPAILQNIKKKHVENDAKWEAEMVFSTVHRCKGMEYDAVQLVNDFITEEKISKMKSSEPLDEGAKAKINEEINLLYVAVTRTVNTLYLPENYLPKDFTRKRNSIKTMKVKKESDKKDKREYDHTPLREKEKRNLWKKSEPKNTQEKSSEAYRAWTKELDNQLMILYGKGNTIQELAQIFKRSKNSISMRISKLETENADREI